MAPKAKKSTVKGEVKGSKSSPAKSKLAAVKGEAPLDELSTRQKRLLKRRDTEDEVSRVIENKLLGKFSEERSPHRGTM